MEKSNSINSDELKNVTGGADPNTQPLVTPEDFKKAAENMLKQADSAPVSKALEMLNGN